MPDPELPHYGDKRLRYLLNNQTVGATLALKVRGTNDGGDGKFSPTVQVTVT